MERIRFKPTETNNKLNNKPNKVKERDPNEERPKRFFKDVIHHKFAFEQENQKEVIN